MPRASVRRLSLTALWRVLLVVLLLIAVMRPAVTATARPTISTAAPALPLAHHPSLAPRGATGAANAAALHGVSISGSEYACIQGWGTSEVTIDQTLVDHLRALGVNTVRLPLNEDCYLGINSTSAYTGTTYRGWLGGAVDTLTGAGLSVILDLHWSAPGTTTALSQWPMPDADHSLAFWRGVATQFTSNPRVLYEAFNEPYPISNGDGETNWLCWRDGGAACPGLGYTAAGMQSIVDTIRATGATQPIIVNGIGYSQIMTGYLTHLPRDPLNNLIAGIHPYQGGWCQDVACWEREYAPVAAVMPLLATEFGGNDLVPVQADPYDARIMTWLAAHGAGMVAWTYNRWRGDPLALLNGDGSLTSWGSTYRDELAALAGAHPALVDGGFEDTTALYDAYHLFGNPSIVPYAQHSGGHAVQLSAANDGVAQTVGNLTPGQGYNASVWATNKVAGQSTCLAIYGAGAAGSSTCTTAGTYTLLTLAFTPTAPVTTATVQVYKTSGYDAAWIDDLLLTPLTFATATPPPTSTAAPIATDTAVPAPPPAMDTATASPAAPVTSTAPPPATATTTATPVPTDTATATATSTATAIPPATPTASATSTPTAGPTSTATPDLRATITALRGQVAHYATAVARVRAATRPLP